MSKPPAIDWTEWDQCSECGQRRGEPCLSLRTNAPLKRPHAERSMAPEVQQARCPACHKTMDVVPDTLVPTRAMWPTHRWGVKRCPNAGHVVPAECYLEPKR